MAPRGTLSREVNPVAPCLTRSQLRLARCVSIGATGLTSRLNVPRGATYEDCLADGSAIAGSPQTVRAEIKRQAKELGINYLLTYMFLGTMSLYDALRSLQLFRSEVMPHVAGL